VSGQRATDEAGWVVVTDGVAEHAASVADPTMAIAASVTTGRDLEGRNTDRDATGGRGGSG
jgi:hypothetical protein